MTTNAIEAYKAKCEPYRKKIADLLNATELSQVPPPVLYHYTDAQGLMSIVDSKELWATNVLYLNDASEIRYAHDLAREFIATLAPDSTIYRTLRKGLGYLSFLMDEGDVDIFISCFSSEPDLLSQWRAYGRSGTGFALGFRTQELMDLASAGAPGNNQSLSLLPIVYSRERQLELMSEFASTTIQRRDEQQIGTFQYSDLLPWITLVTKCKHPLFREENEWRLSMLHLHPHTNPRFRVKDGNIAPYVTIPVQRINALTNVFIGPSLNPQLTKRAVKAMLLRKGYGQVTVEASGVPLRLVQGTI